MLLIVCSRKVIISSMILLMATQNREITAREVFASNLRRLRLELGISQESLAELTELHRTYVGSVERAERNVSIDNMERFAKALKVKLRDML